MSILDELLKLNDRLAAKRQPKSEPIEPIDLSKARLTKEMVLEKASEVAEEFRGLVPSEPILTKDKDGKLVWGIAFLIEGMGQTYIGARGGLDIDDETGEIVGKQIYPR